MNKKKTDTKSWHCCLLSRNLLCQSPILSVKYAFVILSRELLWAGLGQLDSVMLFMPLLLFFHLNIQHPLLPITHMTPRELALHSFHTNHLPVSPPTRPLSHSPKAYASDPNLNPFSPLSPDLAPNQLTSAQKPIMDSVIDVVSSDKPLITYTRRELLLIGRDCRGRGPPETMGALESWFG